MKKLLSILFLASFVTGIFAENIPNAKAKPEAAETEAPKVDLHALKAAVNKANKELSKSEKDCKTAESAKAKTINTTVKDTYTNTSTVSQTECDSAKKTVETTTTVFEKAYKSSSLSKKVSYLIFEYKFRTAIATLAAAFGIYKAVEYFMPSSDEVEVEEVN